MPFLPHSLTHVPSFVNFTTRLFVPFAVAVGDEDVAVGRPTTSVGMIEQHLGPEPLTPALPSVISSLPSPLNLNDLVALAVHSPRESRRPAGCRR